MIWETIKILMVYPLVIDITLAIQCFSCSVMTEVFTTSNQKIVVPSCNTFDGSAKFIIDCPYSTMCLKTVYTMSLLNGQEMMATTLGCAHQKFSQHVLRGRVWKVEHTVKEIYPEDCVIQTDTEAAVAKKTYCYCRGNLCNETTNMYTSNGFPFFLAVISILIRVV